MMSVFILPFIDEAQFTIHRADFQPLILNPLRIIVDHGDVDVAGQVDDLLNNACFHDDEDLSPRPDFCRG